MGRTTRQNIVATVITAAGIAVLLGVGLTVYRALGAGQHLLVTDLATLSLLVVLVVPLAAFLSRGQIHLAEYELGCLTYSLIVVYIVFPFMTTASFPAKVGVCIICALAVAGIKAFLQFKVGIGKDTAFAVATVVCISLILVEKVLLTDNSFTRYLQANDGSVTATVYAWITAHFSTIGLQDRSAVVTSLTALLAAYFAVSLRAKEM